MKAHATAIHDAHVLEPAVFGDSRGFFMESFNRAAFSDIVGRDVDFVQDNHSRSAKGVLRGLHYQIAQPQGKLVRVVSGRVFDVAVDIRRGSPTFGKIACVELSEENRRMFWVPPGLAHGFLVLSEFADFLYKTTDYWAPAHERCILWNDPDLAIPWPIDGEPTLSGKDRQGVRFSAAELFE